MMIEAVSQAADEARELDTEIAALYPGFQRNEIDTAEFVFRLKI